MTTSTGSDLIPELQAIRASFLAAPQRAAEIVAGLTEEQFNQRPESGGWSVCECLGHLIETGEKIGNAIDASIEQAHRKGLFGKGPFRYSRFGNWFVGMATEGTRKVSTARFYEPQKAQSATNVMTAFNALQTNLVERVEASNGLDLGRVKITSPATRVLRLSLGQWLKLLAGHQERHFKQAIEARERVTSG